MSPPNGKQFDPDEMRVASNLFGCLRVVIQDTKILNAFQKKLHQGELTHGIAGMRAIVKGALSGAGYSGDEITEKVGVITDPKTKLAESVRIVREASEKAKTGKTRPT